MNYFVLFALAIALPTVVTAYRKEKGYGMLVAEYTNGSTVLRFRSKILLLTPENNYRFNYKLQSGEKVCTLTGELDIKEITAEDECP